LVPGGGATGGGEESSGFSKSENRAFRLEQKKFFKISSLFGPKTIGALAALALAINALKNIKVNVVRAAAPDPTKKFEDLTEEEKGARLKDVAVNTPRGDTMGATTSDFQELDNQIKINQENLENLNLTLPMTEGTISSLNTTVDATKNSIENSFGKVITKTDILEGNVDTLSLSFFGLNNNVKNFSSTVSNAINLLGSRGTTGINAPSPIGLNLPGFGGSMIKAIGKLFD